MARQQPVARDLRIVVMALRVSASLERMGDIAEHIAQLTRLRFPERAIPSGLKSTFGRMGELDVEAARKLTELLRTEDLRLAARALGRITGRVDVDDVLDVIADTATLGKQQGADIARNKPTYPALMGLEAAQQKAQMLVKEALTALNNLGNECLALRALATFVVQRTF